MHMHPAQLRTAMEHGKHFSGIEQMFCVEGAFDSDLLGEITMAAQHHECPFMPQRGSINLEGPRRQKRSEPKERVETMG